MKAVRLLDLGEVSPARSQALYHGLARRMTEASPDTLVLCRPSRPYFSVGHHQEPEQELDLGFCAAHGYPVFRRRIGGGTVYLDSDQLLYQAVVHASRAPLRVEAVYRRFLSAPVAALRELGLPATLEGTNEIEVRGRRIAGTGGGQIGEAMVVTGNILFDFPRDVMVRAWRVPSEAFRALAAQGLRQSLTTLRRELGAAPPMAAVSGLLVVKYREGLGRTLEDGHLTAAEESAVAEAEGELTGPPEYEPQPRSARVLRIARGVYVRDTEAGPRLEEERVPVTVGRTRS